jgi:hypothetical protein
MSESYLDWWNKHKPTKAIKRKESEVSEIPREEFREFVSKWKSKNLPTH